MCYVLCGWVCFVYGAGVLEGLGSGSRLLLFGGRFGGVAFAGLVVSDWCFVGGEDGDEEVLEHIASGEQQPIRDMIQDRTMYSNGPAITQKKNSSHMP